MSHAALTGLAGTSRYRADIDGLRAVAVFVAIMSHAGVVGLEGGFVGVDIFFVISGFLITGALTEATHRSRTGLLAFYERRIRRILPALGVVVAATAAIAWFVLLPQDLARLGESMTATALFFSNFHFWRRVGYFEDVARTNPLLHTWTLSVEEQFYVVFPLIVWGILRVRPRLLLPALLVLAALSLAASEYLVQRAPTAAFFLTPARGWELLIGALVAVALRGWAPSATIREAAGGLGLAMIGWSVLTFDARTPFPGLHALLPSAGCALAITAGSGSGSLLSRALAWRPLAFVGLVSYSWYLWHWPLFALATYWLAEALTPGKAVGIAAIAFLIASASWWWVEMPVRRSRGRWPFSRLVAFAAAGSAIVAGLGVWSSARRGWPARVAPQVLAMQDAALDASPFRRRCHAHRGQRLSYDAACVFGAVGVPVRQVIWGDSHGAELAVVLGERLATRGEAIRQLTFSSCSAGSSFRGSGNVPCLEQNRAVLRRLVSDSMLGTVFLVAEYPASDDRDFERYFEEFERAASELNLAGKRVVIVQPHPKYTFPVPTRLALAARRGEAIADAGMTARQFDQANGPIIRRLERIRAQHGLESVNPATRLCGAVRCLVITDGAPLYFDGIHLSLAGIRQISALFDPFLGG